MQAGRNGTGPTGSAMPRDAIVGRPAAVPGVDRGREGTARPLCTPRARAPPTCQSWTWVDLQGSPLPLGLAAGAKTRRRSSDGKESLTCRRLSLMDSDEGGSTTICVCVHVQHRRTRWGFVWCCVEGRSPQGPWAAAGAAARRCRSCLQAALQPGGALGTQREQAKWCGALTCSEAGGGGRGRWCRVG